MWTARRRPLRARPAGVSLRCTKPTPRRENCNRPLIPGDWASDGVAPALERYLACAWRRRSGKGKGRDEAAAPVKARSTGARIGVNGAAAHVIGSKAWRPALQASLTQMYGAGTPSPRAGAPAACAAAVCLAASASSLISRARSSTGPYVPGFPVVSAEKGRPCSSQRSVFCARSPPTISQACVSNTHGELLEAREIHGTRLGQKPHSGARGQGEGSMTAGRGAQRSAGPALPRIQRPAPPPWRAVQQQPLPHARRRQRRPSPLCHWPRRRPTEPPLPTRPHTQPPQRYHLGILPTPVHRFAPPGAPAGAEIWIKRDDLSGMQMSGNKVKGQGVHGCAPPAAPCPTLPCHTLTLSSTSPICNCATFAYNTHALAATRPAGP
jgi:hypothetical protein